MHDLSFKAVGKSKQKYCCVACVPISIGSHFTENDFKMQFFVPVIIIKNQKQEMQKEEFLANIYSLNEDNKE